MSTPEPPRPRSAADWLNLHCRCIELDRTRLARELAALGELPANLFARYPVFVTPGEMNAMRHCVEAIESVTELPGFRERALLGAPPIAGIDTGVRGALLGYDFHLAEDGPRLIEINTNAGGAMLSLGSSRAHEPESAACAPLLQAPYPLADLEERLVAMFLAEWQASGREGAPRRIAIIDESPRDQALYPEFLLFRALLAAAGMETLVAAPEELHLANGALLHGDAPVDLVYNRLTDFYLQTPAARALADAHESGVALVTPTPRAHALLARKSNLALLSDPAALAEMGVPEATSRILLRSIPRTVLVEPEEADALWAARKRYYFKPLNGFGSRATYAGAKLTRGTWSRIVSGGYVAQESIAPSRRAIEDGASGASLKLDIRHYTYAGETLHVAARLYRGQTTNFRTPGGGFAPVLLSPEPPPAEAAEDRPPLRT